jgi:glyoxylase-like metal-dependent hydrolase (beta-lactamase superfamily II)
MALTFNRDFDPRYGEAVEVAPGVRRVTARNPGPFTFLGTNTYLIGGDGIAILDPGPADPAHIEALLKAIGKAVVGYILVSHSHADHAAGARQLQTELGVPILASGRRAAQLTSEPSGEAALDAVTDGGFAPDIGLPDMVIVSGPDYRLQAIPSPGHASDHVAFALLGTDLLFSADHVMGWSTTVVAPPDGSMRDYMASLDRLLARPEALYLPAHGAPIRNAHTYVRALRKHRKMRERAILDRLSRGDRTIPDLVGHTYGDIDPRLRGAAALSTLAHLEDLASRGLVMTDGAPSLEGSYWLAAPPEAPAAGVPSASAGSG